jgi:hypothetical protein
MMNGVTTLSESCLSALQAGPAGLVDGKIFVKHPEPTFRERPRNGMRAHGIQWLFCGQRETEIDGRVRPVGSQAETLAPRLVRT